MDNKCCKTCKQDKPLSEFPAGKRRDGTVYYRPHCWSCKYNNHDKGKSQEQRSKEYHRAYYFHNKLDFKYKAYRHKHKLYEGQVISRDFAVQLMAQPCFYCGLPHGHGIDRIDSSKGYTEDNVRSCCEKCNYILGDLPDKAKLILQEGLATINQQEILSAWQIPTKRT